VTFPLSDLVWSLGRPGWRLVLCPCARDSSRAGLTYLLLVGPQSRSTSLPTIASLHRLSLDDAVSRTWAVVAFLAPISERGPALTAWPWFAVAIFLAVTTAGATSVQRLAACLPVLLVSARCAHGSRPSAAAPRKPPSNLHRTAPATESPSCPARDWTGCRGRVSTGFHFEPALMTSGALYQGSFAKSLQKTRTGPAGFPWRALVAGIRETNGSRRSGIRGLGPAGAGQHVVAPSSSLARLPLISALRP